MTGSAVYQFHAGTSPVVVSVPHDGRDLPADIASRMTPAGRALPDTDWHVARLYAFCRAAGAHMLIARYSRYVVDLNRPPDDASLYPGQLATGLCPTRTFAGQPIYRDGRDVDDAERAERLDRYWRPYHDRLSACLEALVAEHGFALLWDAHSIASEVPALFEGTLPELNLGTNGGRSCPAGIATAVADAGRDSPYATVVDGRFRGGYITRHYGSPESGVYAIQLELAQRCYMDEETLRYDETKAGRLTATLERMLNAFAAGAARLRRGG